MSALPQAVPVTVTAPVATHAQPPVATRVFATTDHNPALGPAVVEDENIGICRRCRRVFERPPGVNSGQAQYYRCSECDKSRWSDIIEGSCMLT